MASLDNLDERVVRTLLERITKADSLGLLICVPRKSSASYPFFMRVSLAMLSQELQESLNEHSSKHYKLSSCEDLLKRHAEKMGYEVKRLKFGQRGKRRHNNCILLPWNFEYEPGVLDLFQILFPSLVCDFEGVQGLLLDSTLPSSPDMV